MAIIEKPVSLFALKRLLGVKHRDVRHICCSGNINPMARCKPVRSNKPLELEEVDRANAKFGTAIPEVEVVSGAPQPGAPWQHLAPRGLGYGEWYRLLDFNGYQHQRGPCVAFAWFASSPGADSHTPDWSTDEVAPMMVSVVQDMIPGYVEGTVALNEACGRTDADTMYVWCAIITEQGVFAKRTTKTIADICGGGSSAFDMILFYIRESGGHAADFGGDLQTISGDIRVQFFIGFDSPTGETCTDCSRINGRRSLNCFGGMDSRVFKQGYWDTGLELGFYPRLPRFTTTTQGDYYVFTVDDDVELAYTRGPVRGSYIATVFYKATLAGGGQDPDSAYFTYDGTQYGRGEMAFLTDGSVVVEQNSTEVVKAMDRTKFQLFVKKNTYASYQFIMSSSDKHTSADIYGQPMRMMFINVDNRGQISVSQN